MIGFTGGTQVAETTKNARMQWMSFAAVAVLIFLLLALLGRQWLAGNRDDGQRALQDAGIVMLAQPRELPSLELATTAGGHWNMGELKERWSLVFFGYTYCPDICPTTLAELRQIYQRLPDDARNRVQVLMVTVDPHRDTLQQLRAYLDFFDKDFQGVTGELADIQTLSQAMSIPFIPGDTGKPGYTVDHSGNLALVGPDGRQHGFVRAPFNVPGLIEQLPAVLVP